MQKRRKILLILIITAALLLTTDCAHRQGVIMVDKNGNLDTTITTFGNHTIAVRNEDGSYSFYNDQYPAPSSYSYSNKKTGVKVRNQGPVIPVYGYRNGRYGFRGYRNLYRLTPDQRAERFRMSNPGYQGVNPHKNALF